MNSLIDWAIYRARMIITFVVMSIAAGTFAYLGLPKEVKDNIIMKYYEAGHMMYTDQKSLEKFKTDVVEFMNMSLER